jgi:L-asparaginase II
MDPSGIAAIVERGRCVEAWHSASVAVVDGSGRLVAGFGAPELTTATRSSIKPFQAIPLVESGAADAFGVTSEELAVACASHSGTDTHVRVVSALLARSGATSADLGCGAHLPIEYRISGTLPLAGEDRDPLRHNCSGKHAGFLAVARYLEEPRADYLAFHSGTQRLVRRALARLLEVPETELASGVDGCGAPNYAAPLAALARAMLRLRLAEPDGVGGLSSALARVRDGMLAFPFLVSGAERFDNDLMSSFPNNAVCKSGAEAIALLAFQEPALGIAIKVHDGADRALPPICLAVLTELGVLGSELPAPLARHRAPLVKNHRSLSVGQIRATLTLARG